MGAKEGLLREKESEIQATIREYLKWKGYYVWKNQQSMGSHKGLSDLTAISPKGQVLFIEIKTEKGKLSTHQKEFKREIEAHRGIFVEARSLDDVKHL